MGGGELWSKSKSKSKSIAESLLFKALIRCALSKEGISLYYPPSKSSIIASFYYGKRVPPKIEDEDFKKQMKKNADAFAAALAAKKDKFYEICGVSEAELTADYSNEIKKMEREMYGDLDALAFYGKKTEMMKKVEESEKKRFFKIFGHSGGPFSNVCRIPRKSSSVSLSFYDPHY